MRAAQRSQRHHKCHSSFDGPSCGSMSICSIPPSSHLAPIRLSIHPSIHSFNHLSIWVLFVPHSHLLYSSLLSHLYPFPFSFSSVARLMSSTILCIYCTVSLWCLESAFLAIFKPIWLKQPEIHAHVLWSMYIIRYDDLPTRMLKGWVSLFCHHPTQIKSTEG